MIAAVVSDSASETRAPFKYLLFIADQGLVPNQNPINYIRPLIFNKFIHRGSYYRSQCVDYGMRHNIIMIAIYPNYVWWITGPFEPTCIELVTLGKGTHWVGSIDKFVLLTNKIDLYGVNKLRFIPEPHQNMLSWQSGVGPRLKFWQLF